MSTIVKKSRIDYLFESENVGLSREASVNEKMEEEIFFHLSRPLSRENLRFDFYNLYLDWKMETRFSSSVLQICNHPAYQQIIGLGEKVLPFIFAELRRSPDHWFWALKAITRVDPVSPRDRGNIKEMTQAWLRWAEENNYL